MFDMISDMKPKDKENKPQLGIYLKSLREANSMSLRGLEEKTGISNAFLSQIESGKVKEPSPIMLYKIAEFYGVPYDALMERAGYPVLQGNRQATRAASVVFNRFGSITNDEEQALLDYLSFLRSKTKRKERKE